MSIHPTAIIDPCAELDSTVTVGPYAVIEGSVRIGANSRIEAHAHVSGPTTLGRGNLVGSFATVGAPPQDLKYQNEPTELVIGDNNQIREYASLHRGTPSGRGKTTIGNGNLFMGYTHVAHDCEVHDHVIMANAATLGGHVVVQSRAIIGGLTAVHQFSRIGEYAYVGGMSGISKDIPPFMIAAGIRNAIRVSGVNKIGLRRAGFSNSTIRDIARAHVILFRENHLLQDALEKVLAELPGCPEVARLVAFFRESSRSVARVAGDD